MSSDLELFLQRVMEQALAKSPELGAATSGQSDRGSASLLAEILGQRLAEMFETEEASVDDCEEANVVNVSSDLVGHYEELVERTNVLAAALGACECWGEQSECPVCHGVGRSGWMLPDKKWFAIFVRPALSAVRRLKGARSGMGIGARKNNNGVQE